ncbi:hypothetical protein [Pseudomonas sp. LS.1a]|uniref:hypothetical protein n=1 Tax=Pseudomonas sp. LS.1a TaxID=2920387 RepID=UPI001F1433C5|nr:hypothetical protein [Pseudomonas sp. LS.1a]UMY59802.1 hypothetical protein MKK04_16400 [Pseudomonas sp. LS.1a]
MGITIEKKPELDTNGERWVHFKVEPGNVVVKCEAGEDTAAVLVGSIANPLYKSHQALINRHLAAINQQAMVGTAAFSLDSIPDVALETDDDLFVELAAKHLIKDWKGVDIEEAPGVPAKYSADLCIALIGQYPGVYFLALRTATDIARRVEEKAAATAEKQ